MKYICLGYIEPGTFEGMTEDERHATLDECFEYNDHLRANGHLVAEVTASAFGDGVDPVLEKRISNDDGWPLCGNQGTARPGFAQKVRIESREAGRLIVAQHFSAGIRAEVPGYCQASALPT